MSKGFLFGIPMVLAIIVGLVLHFSAVVTAPWWAAGTLLLGIVIVSFYIRRQKHTDNNEPGKKP